MISLKSEMHVITQFAEKEKKMVAQLHEKMELLQNLECDDISTVFSLFQMDDLFFKFKKQEKKILVAGIIHFTIDELIKDLDLAWTDAVEMYFKFQLLKNGEYSVDRHFSKCSICRTMNICLLLKEYGVEFDANERTYLEEKCRDWEGYFLVVLNVVNAVKLLELPKNLQGKVLAVLNTIQRLHVYNIIE